MQTRAVIERRFWWWPLCWASLAAAICAYFFFWSTFPVTDPAYDPGPSAVVTIGYLLNMVYVLHALGTVPLFLTGLVRLRRRRRLMIAWAATAAAGVVLELQVLPFGPRLIPLPSAPTTTAWGFLPLAAGYLIVGAVLAHIVISATRAPARKLPVSPALQP
jgi:hypothetical protein